MPDRAHPRYELTAQVEVSADGEVLVFRARNASKGGLFLEADPTAHPTLKVGCEITLHICHIEEVDDVDAEATAEDLFVRGPAKIVRIETKPRPGFAVQFAKLNRENTERLDRLVDRARRASEIVPAIG